GSPDPSFVRWRLSIRGGVRRPRPTFSQVWLGWPTPWSAATFLAAPANAATAARPSLRTAHLRLVGLPAGADDVGEGLALDVGLAHGHVGRVVIEHHGGQ